MCKSFRVHAIRIWLLASEQRRQSIGERKRKREKKIEKKRSE